MKVAPWGGRPSFEEAGDRLAEGGETPSPLCDDEGAAGKHDAEVMVSAGSCVLHRGRGRVRA